MFEQIKQQDGEYILHSYGRMDVAIESGSGARAIDTDGKSYLDFTSGIGVNSLGYSPKCWVDAVCAQAAKLQHISNYYYSPVTTQLAKELTGTAGMSRAFFCNSGAEANECAIKIARKAGASRGAYKIITLMNSFHGRTISTLAATGQEAFHKDFLPLTEGFIYCPPGNIEALKAMVKKDVCAVMLECVQGEGGVLPMEDEYLKQLRELCDKNNMLMVLDEVQTGVGRTGSFYAYQAAGIKPDVVTTAKGLGGGLPIGVCMVADRYKDIFVPGNNGSTFGGNPVVCAGALAVIREVNTPEFLLSVREKGAYLMEKLRAIPQVDFVRGKGLMVGISIKKGSAKEVLEACAQKGLLVLTAKELVRLLPPLNISYEELDEGIEILKNVLEGLN